MQVYNNFRVTEYDEARGEVTLAWYDDTRDGQNRLVTPIAQQKILQLAHKIPPEAEVNNWTRAQYLTFFSAQVEDVADIPQFMKDEADNTQLEFVPRVKIVR